MNQRITVTVTATDGDALREALQALGARIEEQDRVDQPGGEFARTTRWEQR